MVNDPIADLLTRIRNAARAGHPSVKISASKTKEQILKVLIDEGYVESYESNDLGGNKHEFKVVLRYDDRGASVIREIKRLSKPGKRLYVSHSDIPKNRGGLGVVVVSTSKGMISDREARKQGIGGELICSIF